MAPYDVLAPVRERRNEAPLAEPRALTADDASWYVLELLDGDEPRLLFWSPARLRVTNAHPADWQLLPDAELFALSVPYESRGR